MTRHRALWLVIVVFALAGLAVLTPASPVYLTKLYSSQGRYDGHSSHYWIGNLSHPDAHVRQQAAFALGATGADADEAVPALAALMIGDTEGKVRSEAALALSKMHPSSRSALAELTQALDDGEPGVRMYAALTLFRLGREARSAVPALIRALGDRANQTRVGMFFFTIRELVALALGRASAGSGEAVPALMKTLGEEVTKELRQAVVRALGEIGAKARPAATRLRELCAAADPELSDTATEALHKIEGEPADDGG